MEFSTYFSILILYIKKKRKNMAKKSTTSSVRVHIARPHKKRPGIHSKKKNCKGKSSKNYRKAYRGQGR